MNKTIFAIILGAIVIAMPVLAATTISLSPTTINVVEGQSFSQVITINPQGIKNYTAKIEIQYPEDLLEVKTFTLASNWMALSQQGYDLIDNENGLLIKTAGYPSGVSEPIIFGTISFSAKQAGSGVIKIGDNSFVLDATNGDVFSSALVQTSVVITSPVSEPESEPETISEEPEDVITEPVSTSTQGQEELIQEQEEKTTTTEKEPEKKKTTLLAAIGNILSFGMNNVWVALFTGVMLLAVLVYFILKAHRKKF